MFPGSDDLANPGYGFVTWGPPGTDEIAFANSAGANGGTTSACVYLEHPDGTGAHPLWCPSGYDTPQAVESIRWADNGKSLLVDLTYELPPYQTGSGLTDRYQIDVATGAATLIAQQVVDSWYGFQGGNADLSYDGTKVVYEPYARTCNDVDAGDSPDPITCVRDAVTGQVTMLLPYGPLSELLMSPDGAEVALTQPGFAAPFPEADAHVINRAGSTPDPVSHAFLSTPAEHVIGWQPVAWSSDGIHLLTNRTDNPDLLVTLPSVEIYVVDVRKTHAKPEYVAEGIAYDWYQPNW